MMDCLLPADSAPGVSPLPLHAVRPAGLESLRAALPPEAAAWLEATGFRAQAGRLALLPGGPSGLAGACLGLGEEEQAAASPWSFGALPFALPEGTAWRLEPGDYDAGAAVLGWCLGSYRFRRFKSSTADRIPARLLAPRGTEDAAATAEAIWNARDLINTPAADLGPAELTEAAGRLAATQGASFEVIEGTALEQGFPAVAAVGRGAESARAPRVAVLRWEGTTKPDAPLVALCGKGVCFDTGGLDIKPAEAMKRMKKDMGGAAVVLGLAEVLMRSRLPIRLLVLIGAVENAVSAGAMRPLDVLRTRKGLTVEVGNTDAEGRLVLADLLTYAGEHDPALIIDCATLTGAARVALGPDLPAFFANDDAVAEVFLAAGRSLQDEMWRMPLHYPYNYWLDSSVADVNNIGSKPMAGAVIAALFLNRFVPSSQRWVHLDVYAWNDSNRPGRPEGGEGQAIRALAGGVSSLFGPPQNLDR
jgi:leucyl aminopeptidase